MTEEQRLAKNLNIRKAQLETKNRRKAQFCRVFRVKIDESRLSKKQADSLKMLFVEAKWIYNAVLNFSETNNIFKTVYNTTNLKTIDVKNKNNEFNTRELKYIGSQMKQSVVDGIKASIKTLATRKKRGYKVGSLKFISDYKSLNLKQYGTTYTIHRKNKMKIQGVKGLITVNGLEQFINIPNIELANAKILNTPQGYYIAVTTYSPIDNEEKQYLSEIGIDLGVKTHLTTSEGQEFNVLIEETERLKRLQRKLARQTKRSNNWYKTKILLQLEHQKLTNRKTDAANKIVAEILTHETVYMQDENLRGWKCWFGKSVHHSVLGRVKSKLMNHPRVEVLDRWAPTSKLCICGHKHDGLTLGDRVFICPICGFQDSRDIHAAKNMIRMIKTLKQNETQIPRGPREFKPEDENLVALKPVENLTSASKRRSKLESKKQEDHTPLGCD